MSYITYSYLTEKMKKGKMRTSLNINQGKLGGGGMVWYSKRSELVFLVLRVGVTS